MTKTFLHIQPAEMVYNLSGVKQLVQPGFGFYLSIVFGFWFGFGFSFGSAFRFRFACVWFLVLFSRFWLGLGLVLGSGLN